MKTLKKYSLLALLIMAASCKTSPVEEMDESSIDQQDNIRFTEEQNTLGGIVTGKLEEREFSEVIVCNGNVEPTPRSLAMITAPYGGVIKSVDHYIGKKVKKGSVLISLENSEIIKLQEEYLKAEGDYEYLQNDFERKKELYADNTVSKKEYLKAKASFLTTEARILSLKAQLKLVSIDAEKIRKNGITSVVQLKSPINGYVSNITGNIGKYVGNQEVLMEVVDPESLHVHIKIFEKDISKVVIGQKVYFSTFSEPDKKYWGSIFSLGHSVNTNDHSVTVHASINNKDRNLIPGLFINAGILTSSERLYSMPHEGVIRGEGTSYIYTEKDGVYSRVPVNIGVSNEDYISILNPEQNILDSNIVLKGVYFINAALEGSNEE